MIVESLLNLFKSLIFVIFGWIDLPDFPSSLDSIINQAVNYMVVGFRFIVYFFDKDVLLALIPFVIVLINFDHVYKFTMFIVRKIPFIGVK